MKFKQKYDELWSKQQSVLREQKELLLAREAKAYESLKLTKERNEQGLE